MSETPVRFHFVSEAEAAKMTDPNTLYVVEGTCVGMQGTGVVFRGCRVLGEAAAVPPAGSGK